MEKFMKQFDMFEELKPKIYESPDGGKTLYERYFGENSLNRRLIKTSTNRWNITFKGRTIPEQFSLL